jgi:ADP-ribosylglycohydrolase
LQINKILEKNINKENKLIENKLKGCLLGALIGDALGAPLEF